MKKGAEPSEELPGWKVLDTLDREDSGLAAVTFTTKKRNKWVSPIVGRKRMIHRICITM